MIIVLIALALMLISGCDKRSIDPGKVAKPKSVSIGRLNDAYLGHYNNVEIYGDKDLFSRVSGFDFLVGFDDKIVTFVDARHGCRIPRDISYIRYGFHKGGC